MIVTKIEIGGFGKLKDFSLNFQDGLQVVYGENEYGKSTIMEFIKTMFYSKRCGIRAGNDDKILRRKYSPWGSGEMVGSIEFIHNGLKYRLQKEINSDSPSKDKVLFHNRSSGNEIILGRGQEAGEYIFGLDLKSFERSGYIGNTGRIRTGNDKSGDVLSSRIILNLFDTGEELISRDAVYSRLEGACKDLQRLRGGKIKELEDKIDKMSQELFRLKEYENNQILYRDELTKIESLINERNALRKKIQSLDNLERIYKIKNMANNIKEINNYKEIIEKKNFNIDRIRRLIKEYSDKKSQIEDDIKVEKELKSIVGNLGDESEIISEQDYQQFNNNIIKLNEYRELISELSEELVFRAENIKNQIITCESNREDMELLKVYRIELDRLRELKENLNVSLQQDKIYMGELQKTYDMETFKIEGEKSNLKVRRDNYDSIISKGKKLTVISGVLSSISVILGVVSGNWIFTFILLLLFSFLLSFTKFYKSKFIKLCINIENDILKNESIIGEKYYLPLEDINKKIIQKSEQLLCIDENQKKHLELGKKYLEADIKYRASYETLRMMKEEFNSQKYKIQTRFRNLILDKEFSEIDIDRDINGPEKYILYIKKLYQEHLANTDDLLDKFNLTSPTEFKEKYLLQSRNKESIKKINHIRDKISQIKSEVVKSICEYQHVDNYESASEVINTLGYYLKELDVKAEETRIQMNVLNIKTMCLETLEKEIQEYHDVLEESLTDEEIEKMNNRLKYLENLALEDERAHINSSIKPSLRSVSELSEEISISSDRLQDMRNYLSALTIASSVLDNAYDEIRNRFSPQLDKRVSEIFKKLTQGKYERLYVQKDYRIFVNTAGADREVESLSNGAIDQVYLSLRIAISELLSKNNCQVPLLLDDSLMQYDDMRLRETLLYLNDYSRGKDESQIILFTCHNYISELARKNGIFIIE